MCDVHRAFGVAGLGVGALGVYLLRFSLLILKVAYQT